MPWFPISVIRHTVSLQASIVLAVSYFSISKAFGYYSMENI